MTRREMVICALQHKETPQLPFHAEFTAQAFDKMVRFTGDANFMENYGIIINNLQILENKFWRNYA
jgi:uroporphyrinogen decarboxylase